MRKTQLVTGHIYHIFNRGVNKNEIFLSQDDYKQFLNAAIHYKTKNTRYSYEKRFKISHDPVSLQSLQLNRALKIDVIAYCLMPNHFHFLVKQESDRGITSFMRHLMNSYSHFVNLKYKRVGPLFQGRFKAVIVDSDEQLLHLSRYIHLNPLVSNLVSDLESYPWSSYVSYIGKRVDNLANSQAVLNSFKSKSDYRQFVLDQEDYARGLENIKHLTNEE